MASCIRPAAKAGSTWFTYEANSLFLSPMIAVVVLASWPWGVSRFLFRPPPKALSMSASTPARILDS